LERHDRARFEVIGVSLGPPDDSEIRARIGKAFDQFHDMHTHPDDSVVTLLRQLNADIAVDLAGYTQYGRLGVLARRVAPIQASYLGYCGTSGSDFIDYLLVDRIVAPPDEQRYFTEKLVHLPDSFMVADPTQLISDAMLSRRECGLPDDGFVFCCFNKNYKITQPVFDVWMRLLRSVDGSVLWLSDNLGDRNDNMRRYAEARGIDSRRLVFAPNLAARADHFARHRLADLFLDTLPYNAHTTACDALFAGLPVLTIVGPTFVGRVAASMLHAIGLDELVTRSLEEYEALALDLARDAALMRTVRAKLAANHHTRPLFDTDRFRRNIERAYDQMFEIYRLGERPRTFNITAE
jgi:predicted O-linked N-acetylglucosamine transferase (SPINDLY family)